MSFLLGRLHLRGRRRHRLPRRRAAHHRQELSRQGRRHSGGRGLSRRLHSHGAIRRTERCTPRRDLATCAPCSTAPTTRKTWTIRAWAISEYPAYRARQRHRRTARCWAASRNPPPGNNAIAYDRTTRQVLNIVYGGVNATKGLVLPQRRDLSAGLIGIIGRRLRRLPHAHQLRESPSPLPQERPRGGLRGVIHVVQGDIVASRAGRAGHAHRARDEAPAGIARQERAQRVAAIGAGDAEPLDVVQTRRVVAVLARGES